MKTGIVLVDSEFGRPIVKRYCRKEGVSIVKLEELIAAELEQAGKLTKRGIRERFDEILSDSDTD